jgi:hypothetical protein
LPYTTAINRAYNFRRRLGDTGLIGDPIEKPPGMRWDGEVHRLPIIRNGGIEITIAGGHLVIRWYLIDDASVRHYGPVGCRQHLPACRGGGYELIIPNSAYDQHIFRCTGE